MPWNCADSWRGSQSSPLVGGPQPWAPPVPADSVWKYGPVLQWPHTSPEPHGLCREPYAPVLHGQLHGATPYPPVGTQAPPKAWLCNQLDRTSDLPTSTPTVISPFTTEGCMELAHGGYLENIVLGNRRYATEPYRLSPVSGHFSKVKKYNQLI